jgi:hypothetical protein
MVDASSFARTVCPEAQRPSMATRSGVFSFFRLTISLAK